VSFLLEHKSYLPKNVHLQLLRYLCNIYDKQLEKGGKLHLVIPIVIYHGRKSWRVRSFSDYFALPLSGLTRYLPQFDYEFIDLGKVDDDEIVEIDAFALRNAIFLLKYTGRYKMYLRLVSRKFITFTEEGLTYEEKVFANRMTLKYLYMTVKEDLSAIIEEMKAGLADVEPLEGSIADILIKQGREEGREEGIEIGIEKGLEIEKLASRFEDKLEVLQKLVEKGLEVDFIAFVSGLPLPFVKAFARAYQSHKMPLLLEAVARARRAPGGAAAAAEIRAGLLSFDLTEPEVDNYFESVRGI
jgi:predicted transposase/invertase (TIGR01784 family)